MAHPVKKTCQRPVEGEDNIPLLTDDGTINLTNEHLILYIMCSQALCKCVLFVICQHIIYVVIT